MSGPDLQTLQGWMQTSLMTPRLAESDKTNDWVKPSHGLAPAERLAVYQRSFIERLRVCMAEQFPALRHALGEPLFDDMASDYIRNYPPESYTLYDLGRRFETYLSATRPDANLPPEKQESWVDFMIELVRFERQIFVLYDAPGHEGRPYANANIPDNELVLQPCLELGAFHFEVAQYYHQVRAGGRPELPKARPSYIALVRKDFRTQTLNLTYGQYRCLQMMTSGAGLPDALANISLETGRPLDEIERSWRAVGGPRQRWIKAGVFVQAEAQPAASSD